MWAQAACIQTACIQKCKLDIELVFCDQSLRRFELESEILLSSACVMMVDVIICAYALNVIILIICMLGVVSDTIAIWEGGR